MLREYRVEAAEIDRLEDLARRDGYAALMAETVRMEGSEFACETGEGCFDSRTVTVREGSVVSGLSVAAAGLAEDSGLRVAKVTRVSETFEKPAADFVLQAGDELLLEGSTEAFARNAAKFRKPSAVATAAGTSVPVGFASQPKESRRIDTEAPFSYLTEVDASVCEHVEMISRVSECAGCEECIAMGSNGCTSHLPDVRPSAAATPQRTNTLGPL